MTNTWVTPEQYDTLLSEKIQGFRQQLNQVLACELPDPAVFESPKAYYRLRAEFRIWHEGQTAFYAMTDAETKKPIMLEHFPVANERINQLMPPLLKAINQNEVLRRKLFQVEFLSTLRGETLVSLIYHKPLDDDWTQAVTPLMESLNIHIIGRSRKQKRVLAQDFVVETLNVGEKAYEYQQIEGSFTQPNGKVCEQMLTWASEQSQGFNGDLLELYCGNGNFTLPLAANFNKVLATEISKPSIRSALDNCERNQVNNIQFVRMSSEELTQALNGEREFRRLAEVDLSDYEFSTIFVDPPRAGLDDKTLALASTFKHIIYISCNPETLAANLQQLSQSHHIQHLAAFDQFPYTHHLEAGVILTMKS